MVIASAAGDRDGEPFLRLSQRPVKRDEPQMSFGDQIVNDVVAVRQVLVVVTDTQRCR
jgi:hypothetical protein